MDATRTVAKTRGTENGEERVRSQKEITGGHADYITYMPFCGWHSEVDETTSI